MRRVVLIALSTLVACTSAGDDGPPTMSTASAIVNGTLDTAHSAVVTVVSDPSGPEISVCSGTIVKIEPENGTGWVATAAHCVVEGDPKAVYSGTDYSSPARVKHGVISFAADSRFSLDKPENGYDFAVIRIGNVDASTPFIPLATAPDSVAVGTDIVNVGFGRTTRPPDMDDTNSQRWTISKSLSQTTDRLIGYDSRTSGACQGDSGGPWLLGTGSDMRVVGIDSFGNTTCSGDAFASRVETGLAFFNQQLGIAGPDECQLCTTIATSTGGKCEKSQAVGRDLCVCSDACADACKSAAQCTSLPSCTGDDCASDAGTATPDPPASDAGPTIVVVHTKGDGGCNTTKREPIDGAFALLGLLLVVRLRPYRSGRR